MGSNLGHRLQYLTSAYKAIEMDLGRIVLSSPVYQSMAWGYEDQGDFLNSVLMVDTLHSPLESLKIIKAIEKKLGRKVRDRWHQREIDIDIIFYDSLVIEKDDLIIPHPHYHLRNFVLKPLMDILPNYEDPHFHKPIYQIDADCPDQSIVEPFAKHLEV
ncbi:2-amino-4-hydroxy-6-hydroxymethyldihydropteridine diphosphokinase [Membranihabitans marinus]